MKRFEFSIAAIVSAKSMADAYQKLYYVLSRQYLNLYDDELDILGDLILDFENWDCEEYDD